MNLKRNGHEANQSKMLLLGTEITLIWCPVLTEVSNGY